MANYMQRLIEKARGGVQDGIKNIKPLKKLTDALDTGGGPSPPKRSNPVPPEKRKKIKPKSKSSFD